MKNSATLDSIILTAIDNSNVESKLGYVYIKGLVDKVEVVYKIEKNLRATSYLKIVVENTKIKRDEKTGRFRKESLINSLGMEIRKQQSINNQIQNTLQVSLRLAHIEQVLIRFLHQPINQEGKNCPKIEVLITSNLHLGVEEIQKINEKVKSFFRERKFRLPH